MLAFLLIGGLSKAAIQGDTSIHQHLRKFKIVFVLDLKRPFSPAQKVRVGGIKVGFQYKNKFRTGIGVYQLLKPAIVKTLVYEGTPSQKTVNANLDIGYLSLFFEPILLKTRKWELSTPLQLGSATARLSYTDTILAVPQKVLISKRKSPLLEGSFVAEYRLVRWLGFGAGIGYRQMLSSDPVLKKNFNGPIYIVKAKIYFHEIYNTVFNRDNKPRKK
ncbi:MAG: hypothetical protein ACJ75J_03985 [Cytophagaceae bacterium]